MPIFAKLNLEVDAQICANQEGGSDLCQTFHYPVPVQMYITTCRVLLEERLRHEKEGYAQIRDTCRGRVGGQDIPMDSLKCVHVHMYKITCANPSTSTPFQ